MSTRAYFEYMRQNPLFSGLGEESLKALYSISEEMRLKKGDFLMREGDAASDLFFIFDGKVEIIKFDAETQTNFVVNLLHPGDTVGEQALIDKGKRSASVRAATNVKFYKISFANIENLSKQYPDFLTIYNEISRRISQKLRETTDVAAVALKKELLEFKNRVSMGTFLVYVITLITLFVFTVRPLKYALSHVPNTTFISIPLIVFLTLFVYFFIRACPFPLETFGFTRKNWKKALFESTIYSIPVLGLIVLIKWLLLKLNPAYKGHALFEPFALMPGETWSYWLLNSFVYCLFIPLQEIMARGALQGPMEKFLSGKNKVWTAIIISNLIFSSSHVFISEEVASLVFIFGVYFGWLYSRTYNLVGVINAHCIVGIWGLNVVGPVLT